MKQSFESSNWKHESHKKIWKLCRIRISV